MNDARRAVLIDMAYEIGGVGLAGFVDLLAAVRAGQWAKAAMEIKNSLLYTQVPRREQENMMILALGQFPPGINSVEDLIKRHEGLALTARPDSKGKWELGYGHDIPAPISEDICCTQEQADAWFVTDFATAARRAEADLGSTYWQGD